MIPSQWKRQKKIITGIEFTDDMYKVPQGADLLIVITDWNEFKELDLEKVKSTMKAPNMIDARNIYDPKKMKEAGFSYRGVGRL